MLFGNVLTRLYDAFSSVFISIMTQLRNIFSFVLISRKNEKEHDNEYSIILIVHVLSSITIFYFYSNSKIW